MNRRTIKQTIIAFIFFLILFGIGFWIYYSQQPEPTCFDGIRNQNEEEIDCGGSCLPCELVYIKELKVLSAEAILNQGAFYDVFAQIENLNQNYGSKQIPYEFEFYDSEDNIVARHSGQTFILPGQTKYLVQVKIESIKQIDDAKLSFGQIEWEKLNGEQTLDLVIRQKEYRLLSSDEFGFSQARGILVNKTNFNFKEIDIDVLLYNSSYQLIGLGVTKIRTLLAGEERDFITTWFSEINEQVSFVEMEAETNLFDSDNYVPADGGETERFQEY